MGLNWYGPSHTARELRRAKSHRASGGIVYVARSPGDMAAITRLGDHARANEMGALLNAPTHQSLGKTWDLAREIPRACYFSIGREAIPHEDYPAVRFYAFTRVNVGLQRSRPGVLLRTYHQASDWIYVVSTNELFMFAKGWLADTAISHPVVDCPVGAVMTTTAFHYCVTNLEEDFCIIQRCSRIGRYMVPICFAK